MHPHTIRVSRRSRRLRLTVTARHGVVVTVPVRFNPARVGPFVQQHAAWIERALRRVAVERPDPVTIPTTIHLRALEEAWTIQHAPSAARTVTARSLPGNVLVLGGKTADTQACVRALQRWLQRRADDALPALVLAHAATTGLRPRAIRIRGQHTIWGSCAADGTINLNRQLLFFPPALADTVLHHELCHLRWRGHGVRFWTLMAQHVPDLAERRNELRTARRFVPGWARIRGSDPDQLA